MSNPQAQQLLQQGVLAAKAGNKDEAYALIKQALELDPQNESALLALFSVASDNRERLQLLKQVLEINPNNDKALGILDKMGIAPERLIGQRPTEATAPKPIPEPEETPPSKPNLQSLRSLSTPKQEESTTGVDLPPWMQDESTATESDSAPSDNLPPWMQDEPPETDSETTSDLPPWMQDESTATESDSAPSGDLTPWMQDEPAQALDSPVVPDDVEAEDEEVEGLDYGLTDEDLQAYMDDSDTETDEESAVSWMESDDIIQAEETVEPPSPAFQRLPPKTSPLVNLPTPPPNPNANVAGVPLPNLNYLRHVYTDK